MYLHGAGTSRDDFRYGARWLSQAAQKGQHQAQALLGQMLFNGDQLPRQAARGLMWLTLARDSAAETGVSGVIDISLQTKVRYPAELFSLGGANS